MKKIVVCFFVLAISIGCHFSEKYQNREQDRLEAEKTTHELFGYLKNKEYLKAATLFDEEFYKVTSKKKLIEIFTTTHEKLGLLEKVTLMDWNTAVSEGAINTGNYVLNYTSEFAKGSAIQRLSLRKNENGDIKIIGYTVKLE